MCSFIGSSLVTESTGLLLGSSLHFSAAPLSTHPEIFHLLSVFFYKKMGVVTVIPPYHHLMGQHPLLWWGDKLFSALFEWLSSTFVLFLDVDQSTSEEWSEPEQNR